MYIGLGDDSQSANPLQIPKSDPTSSLAEKERGIYYQRAWDVKWFDFLVQNSSIAYPSKNSTFETFKTWN